MALAGEDLIVGALVRWTRAPGSPIGVIVAADWPRLKVRLDGDPEPKLFNAKNHVVDRVQLSGMVKRASTGSIGLLHASTTALPPRWQVILDGRLVTVAEADLRPHALDDPHSRVIESRLGSARQFALAVTARRYELEQRTNELVSLGTSRVAIKPHQVSVVHRVVTNYPHRFLLCDEVGLGKTIEAGMILKELRARGGAQRVLVIAPPNILRQWQFELKSKFNESFSIINSETVKYLKSQQAVEENPFLAFDSVMVSSAWISTPKWAALAAEASWDMVIVDEAHHARVRRSGNRREENRLYKVVRDVVSPSAFSKRAALFLTATPMQLDSGELYSLVELLDPALFPTEQHFDRHRAEVPGLSRLVHELTLHGFPLPDGQDDEVVAKVAGWLEIDEVEARERLNGGASSLELLGEDLSARHLLSEVLIRNRKKLIGGFMPRHAHRWEVELSVEERTALTAVEAYVRDGFAMATRTNDSAAGFVMVIFQKLMASSIRALRESLERRRLRLEAAALNPTLTKQAKLELDDLEGRLERDEAVTILLDEIATADAGEADDLKRLVALLDGVPTDSKAETFLVQMVELRRLDPGAKVLLFTEFRETQEYLRQRLHESGWHAELFHGQLKPEQKDAAVDRFREAVEPCILLSTEAGGEGRNFQFCHLLVNYDLPWNPMRVEQRIGRVDRIGQASTVQVFNFWVKGTVEERVLNVLERRINIFEETVGGLDPILGEAERDLKKILLLGGVERDRALERYETQLERRIGQARSAEEKLRDFIMETKSYSKEISRLLIEGESPITPAAQETFVARLLLDVKTSLSREPDGTFDLTFNEPFVSDFPQHVKDGLRRRRATFRADVRPDSEQVEYLALGHPVIDDLVGRVTSSSYVGSAAAFEIEEQPDLAPAAGWLAVYEIGVPAIKEIRQLVPLFVEDGGGIIGDFGERILERAATFPNDHSLSPGDIVADSLDPALVVAEAEAFNRLRDLEERAHGESARQIERERSKLTTYFEYRQHAAADRLESSRAVLAGLEASEQPESRRILPVWRANVSRDERLIEELADERTTRLAQLEHAALGGATYGWQPSLVLRSSGKGPDMVARTLPFQHLSLRVPWHDTGYEGTICADPLRNSACLRLSRIAEERDDAREMALAGVSWADLKVEDLPPCASERAGFMSHAARHVVKQHPYAAWNEVYRKFKPTTFQIPAFAADCVPFRWMLRTEAVSLAERLELPYEAELEEAVDAEAKLNSPSWVQHEKNQRLLLDTFFSSVEPHRSLCFVYAKETPLTEDHGRVLLGVGRTTSVAPTIPYDQAGGGFGSVLWERVVGHTIRPTMDDGFLLPYHEILELEAQGACDARNHAVMIPDDLVVQFSYATEHVSHDAAVQLLLQLDRAVGGISDLVSGSWAGSRAWLSERLAEVWQARGPCPGLGAALTAFGVTSGVLVAHKAQTRLADNEDPWPLIDSWLRDPAKEPALRGRIGPVTSKAWEALPEGRRALLRLLSRFDLTTEQATRFYQPTERGKAGIAITDNALAQNPYLLFELDRTAQEPITVTTVDRGVFPADQVRVKHPLPETSRIDEPVDPRRVRAMVIDRLEAAADGGDTLRSQGRVVQEVRERPLDPPCPLSIDFLAVCEPSLPPEVHTVTMANGEPAYQLARLQLARHEIGRQVNRRRKGVPLKVDADWRRVIDNQLGAIASDADDEEDAARAEKAAALEVLATSRVSVLIGAAGTGKTTLLRALTTLPGVAEGGVLLLAPTGKARVRLQAAIGQKASTVAQLLIQLDRYDSATGRYHRSDHDRVSGHRTVVIDESSMLTEEALDAVLDALEGFDRLILVGDPRQLPPIGAGRPFVDIIEHLRPAVLGFPRVAPCYAELTIHRRQVAEAGARERPDLLLAEWFGGGDPSPAADEIWDRLAREGDLGSLAARSWTAPADLHATLRGELASGLDEMADPADACGFERSYGGNEYQANVYFRLGAAKLAESWQVLSPVRAAGGGVNELNRMLQRTYRRSMLDLARQRGWSRKVPWPAGAQEIVYGDKVINVVNKRRSKYWPQIDDALEYVANGEIGVITGPFKGKGKKVPLNHLEVEFSTQQGTAYKFWMSELGSDDSASVLELAYAVTVHKSQGSEFGRTFVIIPNPCRLLSRELLYTALTRQRDHVVLFHQGDLAELRKYSSALFSETASRMTNLFSAPSPVEVDGRYLEEGLIHQTRKGIAVRSKSEVIIADLLFSKGIDFDYERALHAADGTRRLPDFTIVDDTTGLTIYWEHLGMLHRPSYRRQWEKKLQWYKANGILPQDDGHGAGPNGLLVTSPDISVAAGG